MKLLGLNITTTEIHAVLLKNIPDGQKMLLAEIIPLSANSCSDGHLKHPAALKQVLQTFVNHHQLKGLRVALSIPAHLTIMQRIKVPIGLQNDHIFTEIKTHLKQSLKVTEPLAIDFTCLAEDEDATIHVHYTAIRANHLIPYAKVIVECGLQLKIIDVDIYALKRVVNAFAKQPLTDINAALHIGEHLATFILFNNVEILNYATWDVIDPNHMSKQLLKHLQLAVLAKQPINHFIICSQNKFSPQLDCSGLYANCEYLQLPSHSPSLSTNLLLFAYGVAMREVPLW